MNLVFLAIEFAVVSILLLGAYRLRSHLGLSAVVATVASMQLLQTLLASSFYWEIGGLMITPGSCVLFVSNLALVLVAFADGGARQARTVLYAVMIGNLVPSVLGTVLSAHIDAVEPFNPMGIPPAIFEQGVTYALVGLVFLYLDQLLAVLTYSWLRDRLPRVPAIVYYCGALLLALSFDTVGFLGALYYDSPDFERLLVSGLVSKGLGALAFGLVWGAIIGDRRDAERRRPRQVLQTLLFQEDVQLLREAASTDRLTGLYNRRSYELVLDDLLAGQGTRRVSDPFALILCDADNFKAVNDRLGHATGDELLVRIADHICQSIRVEDVAFRLGGDEFGVILPHCAREGAMEVARRIGEFVYDPPELGGAVTLTVGVAVFPDDGTSERTLFEVADRRLYTGKQTGRHPHPRT